MRTRFGETSGGDLVEEVRLSAHGLSLSAISLGAVLRDLRLEGVAHPLVLGLDSVADYEAKSPHFGAIAGRCANRVDHARFTLDGVERRLSVNEPPHSLHGGVTGFGKRVWELEAVEAERAVFRLVSEDGDMGYPGRMIARCVYALLPGPELSIGLTAETDAPTLCNLVNHSYFNLDGKPDVSAHRLRIAAEAYAAPRPDLIPTGDILRVEGTRHDFRETRPAVDGDVRDHNFCLAAARSAAPRFAARLEASELAMEVHTTEPGLQFYDGAKIARMEGLDGRAYGPNAGLCLEAQFWPDAIHHPHFPSAALRPGERYRQETRLSFART